MPQRKSLPLCSPFLGFLSVLAFVCWTAGCGQSSYEPTQSPASSVNRQASTKPLETKHDDHAHDDDDHAHDDHAHDDHAHEHADFVPAKTIAEAIARVKAFGSKIAKALADKEMEVADDLVHSVGQVIEDLHEKIAAAELDEKARKAAAAAADSIFDAYEKLDSALHGAEEEIKKIDFATYLPTLDSATKALDEMFSSVEKAVIGETETKLTPSAKPTTDDKKPVAE